MNDEQVAESIRADLEHVREHSHRVRDPEVQAEFLYAVREIGLNAVALAGNGHVPVPERGETPALDYAALVTSVISVNVRVFVSRPHDVRESETLAQIAAAVQQLRVGVDTAS